MRECLRGGLMDVYDLIETPENVELEQRLAGIGSRFLAGFLDVLLLSGLILAMVVVLMIADWTVGFGAHRAWATAFLIFAWFVISWGYYVAFEYWGNGQTPGKRAGRIRVVKEGGRPMRFVDVAIRNLLRLVDGFPVSPIGGLVMFLTKKCQRLGDLAAGTVVVSEQVTNYSARAGRRFVPSFPVEPSAAALQSTGLLPEEFRVLTNYCARREQLTVKAREDLLPKLLMPILTRMGHRLANRRLGTLEAYVDLLMRQAWHADHVGQTPPGQEPLRL